MQDDEFKSFLLLLRLIFDNQGGGRFAAKERHDHLGDQFAKVLVCVPGALAS